MTKKEYIRPMIVPNAENGCFLDIRDSATTLHRALAVYGVWLTGTCLDDSCPDYTGQLVASVDSQPVEGSARYVRRENDDVRIELRGAR